MIRIRFHGRGGHGIKTASRIVGTAAFFAGYQVQDSPVYGAERRGAAVVAFTRIAQEPILERGAIACPDLIVVGDETLLEDPGAGVLAGQELAGAIFLNAESAHPLVEKYALRPRAIAWDITNRALEILGSASALSAGLAAAAAKLTGAIAQDNLLNAVREELEDLHVAQEAIAKNLALAGEVFDGLPSLELQSRDVPDWSKISPVNYEGLLASTPSILTAGNAELRQTGSWRVERPEIDRDLCTRCGLCFARCPDGAIAFDEEGYPIIDYEHCKGCMICWALCPARAIARKKEVRAW
ncbi:MAG: 2-oxoacid:acceptor oxidoreductase family protein [Synechococcus sp.]